MSKITALTICSFNYVPKALVLINSYRTIHPDHSFTIVIVDKKRLSETLLNEDVNILWVEDLLKIDFNKYAFTFDIIEFNTNVKPMAIKYLLETNDKVIYLDPDIQLFSKMDIVLDMLNSASILITPHSTTPILDNCKPDDSDLLRFGAYNLGFVAVSNCKETFSFLDWWSDRCLKLGFYEPQLGLAVDQKWIDLAPSFFPNLKICNNLGLNVAFWNLHERKISKSDDKWFVNETIPLVFFHFSSFDTNYPNSVAFKQTRYENGARVDFIEIAKEYISNLNKYKLSEFEDQKYSFDYFDDGVYITPIARRIYSIYYDDLFSKTDPFKSESIFRKFALKNRLININQTDSTKRPSFKDIDKFKSHEFFVLKGLKIILFLFGPDKYFALMKYLPYISSIRNQKKLVSK